MSDDVDDLLRRAMATLDRQVPPGYFDALPGRTLARLEEPASPRTSGRRRTAAIAGLVLAAAAGVVIFWTVRDRDRADMAARPEGAQSVAAESPPAAPARAPAPPIDPGAAGAGGSERTEAPSAAATAPAVAEPDVLGKIAVPATKRSNGKRPPSKGAALSEPQGRWEPDGQGASSGSASPAAPRPGGDKPASGGGSGADPRPRDEPLGQGKPTGAQGKKPVKLKSGQASVQASPSADDVRRGMTAVAAQVQACYAGTQGVASLQVTVAPSGQIAKVTVTGPFAGTPVGTCVERAVAAAKFPPRDGGPQRFGYSFQLSD